MKLQNGHLIAVPIPKTEECVGEKIESAIKEALIEAKFLEQKLKRMLLFFHFWSL